MPLTAYLETFDWNIFLMVVLFQSEHLTASFGCNVAFLHVSFVYPLTENQFI